MDAVSFYSHEHELEKVDLDYYGFSDFWDLYEEPEIDRVIPIKGKKLSICFNFVCKPRCKAIRCGEKAPQKRGRSTVEIILYTKKNFIHV